MQNINNLDSLGVVIKSARKATGMTQSQLAEKLSISTRYLKGIENSGRKPSYDLLVRIVFELDISADMIFRSEYIEEKTSPQIIVFRKAT